MNKLEDMCIPALLSTDDLLCLLSKAEVVERTHQTLGIGIPGV